MIYSDVINNCQFESYYDKGNRTLHVLDEMGFGNQPRMSITNGIDNLIPVFENKLGIKHQYKIYLYGTDGIITEFDNREKSFISITPDNPKVFPEFKEKMEILYA